MSQTNIKDERTDVPTGILFEPSIDDVPEGLKKLSCPDRTIISLFMPGSTLYGRRCYVQGLSLRELTEIVPVDMDSSYCFNNGLFYNSIKTELYFALAAAKPKDLYIPSSVKRIAGGAFSGQMFGTISIPDSVVEIGHSAFYACKAEKMILWSAIIKVQSQNSPKDDRIKDRKVRA